MAREMSRDEWHAFVMEGTRTGKLAVTRTNGAPHVVPVWFVLQRPPDAFVSVAGTVRMNDGLDEMLP